MEIRLLGPVELWSRERRIGLESDKERIALASLALSVNQPVGMDALLDHLWDGADPPPTRQSVYKPISQLRGHLVSAADTACGAGVPRIVKGSSAYTLETDPLVVDVNRHRALVARGRELASSGDDSAAYAVLTEAAGLRRGEPLLGLNGSWPDRMRRALTQLLNNARASRFAAGLRLGRYEEAVGELSMLVEQYPTDEIFAVQLMLALAGTGQILEATTVHDSFRRRLASEFGLDPGPSLSRVHDGLIAGEPAELLVGAIMGSAAARTGRRPAGPRSKDVARHGPVQADPAHGSPSAPRPPTGNGLAPGSAGPMTLRNSPPPPQSLPRQAALIGRRAEVAELTALITASLADARTPDTVTLAAVIGMPGVGKTTLAVNVARDLAPHFPDGQVFLPMGGHSEDGPIPEGEALTRLLAMIGVPKEAVPSDITARGALWRTMLAERRCLLVLDDAGDPSQVLPLLPGDSPSFTIVTSRRQLVGIPGSVSLTVGLLPATDAVALFRAFAGTERTQDETAVERITGLTGYIPLAVELIAIRFSTRPSWDLAGLASRLSRLPGRLGEIRDMNREMARAFELSYQTLSPDQRQAFRHLGLHPGHGFTVQDMQALLGRDAARTERLLETLLGCHLILEPEADRFGTHHLVREFAVQCAYEEQSAEERRAAIARLVGFYTDTADRAVRAVLPINLRTPPRPEDPHRRPPRWDGVHEAKTWLATERRNLAAAESMARTNGDSETAAQLGQLLALYLDSESIWPEAEVLHRRGTAHWSRTGDRQALRQALVFFAENQSGSGKFSTALEACERILETARSDGDRDAEAAALGVEGVVRWRMGDLQRAIECQRAALAIWEANGNEADTARCRNNLAMALLDHVEFTEAETHFEQALRYFNDVGDARSETSALNNLGNAHGRKGDLATARRYFETALARSEYGGSIIQTATSRSNLAEVLGRLGDFDQALDLHHRAVSEFREVRNRFGLANALNSLGQTYTVARRYNNAVHQHRSALDIAEEIGAESEVIVALLGLSHAELARGDIAAAERHVLSALGIAEQVDATDEFARAQDALAHVLAARGRTQDAIPLMRKAVAAMRGVDPYEAERMEAYLAELRYGDRRGRSTEPPAC